MYLVTCRAVAVSGKQRTDAFVEGVLRRIRTVYEVAAQEEIRLGKEQEARREECDAVVAKEAAKRDEAVRLAEASDAAAAEWDNQCTEVAAAVQAATDAVNALTPGASTGDQQAARALIAVARTAVRGLGSPEELFAAELGVIAADRATQLMALVPHDIEHAQLVMQRPLMPVMRTPPRAPGSVWANLTSVRVRAKWAQMYIVTMATAHPLLSVCCRCVVAVSDCGCCYDRVWNDCEAPWAGAGAVPTVGCLGSGRNAWPGAVAVACPARGGGWSQ